MKIESVEFVLSAGNTRECPEDMIAEIAVSGRSNVGKSSLMNSLFGRKNLVKVSGTPGSTWWTFPAMGSRRPPRVRATSGAA